MARALTKEEVVEVIKLLERGFFSKTGETRRPNPRVAMVCRTQAMLGLRIGDVTKLKLSDIVKDGDRYRLNIIEEKTGKARQFTVPTDVQVALLDYSSINGIKNTRRLFPIHPKTVNAALNHVFKELEIEGCSTHSFRKFFATQIYLEHGKDINLVRELLQHTSVVTTQRYIGIEPERIEKALSETLFVNNIY